MSSKIEGNNKESNIEVSWKPFVLIGIVLAICIGLGVFLNNIRSLQISAAVVAHANRVYAAHKDQFNEIVFNRLKNEKEVMLKINQDENGLADVGLLRKNNDKWELVNGDRGVYLFDSTNADNIVKMLEGRDVFYKKGDLNIYLAYMWGNEKTDTVLMSIKGDANHQGVLIFRKKRG